MDKKIDITCQIARAILVDHFSPHEEGIGYRDHEIDGGDLFIEYVDNRLRPVGSMSRYLKLLKVQNVYDHPIVIEYTREMSLKNILE